MSIRVESTYATTVLYPLTLSSGIESRVSTYRSHSLSSAYHTFNSCSFPSVVRACQFLLFFLSVQADSFTLSSAPCKCIPIRTLCLQHTTHPIPALFPQYCAHANSFSSSSARKPIPSLCLRCMSTC